MHIWETWLVKKLIHPLLPHMESRVDAFCPWRYWLVKVDGIGASVVGLLSELISLHSLPLVVLILGHPPSQS